MRHRRLFHKVEEESKPTMALKFNFGPHNIFTTACIVFMMCAFSFSAAPVGAQSVRLRGKVNPACAVSNTTKFADIFADGNIAVQGSYSCRGAFIYNVSDPKITLLILVGHSNISAAVLKPLSTTSNTIRLPLFQMSKSASSISTS